MMEPWIKKITKINILSIEITRILKEIIARLNVIQWTTRTQMCKQFREKMKSFISWSNLLEHKRKKPKLRTSEIYWLPFQRLLLKALTMVTSRKTRSTILTILASRTMSKTFQINSNLRIMNKKKKVTQKATSIE